MAARSPSVDGVARASVRVRPATAADLDVVDAIERASFADPWPTRAFNDSLRDDRLLFLVATESAQVVGYVIAWFVADEGEIANLAVAPSARCRGIGAALLDSALGLGRARGTSATYLEVRESNAAARALYASRGFEAVGRRKGYYRRPVEDAIVLRRVEAS